MGSQIMKIADMILPDDCVDKRGWVDLEKWSGRKVNAIPLKYRDRDDGRTHVSSLTAELKDPNCDPRSGGVAGTEHLCQFYGVGPQQFSRSIAPKRPFLRRLGNIWVSNVNSIRADGLAYRESIAEKRRANLIQYCLPSSYW